jgi:hypothetical protein
MEDYGRSASAQKNRGGVPLCTKRFLLPPKSSSNNCGKRYTAQKNYERGRRNFCGLLSVETLKNANVTGTNSALDFVIRVVKKSNKK